VVKRGDSWAGVAIYRAAKKAISYQDKGWRCLLVILILSAPLNPSLNVSSKTFDPSIGQFVLEGKSLKLIGQVGGPTNAVAVQGQYAYVGVGMRMVVLDVSKSSKITQLGATKPLDGFVTGVVISEKTAYVTVGGAGLYSVNIANPRNPSIMGFYDSPGYPENVCVSGNYAYLADGWAGMQVVDISDPKSPKETGSISTIGYAFDVAVDESVVYIAAAGAGLKVVDVKDVTKPVEIGGCDTPGYAYGLALSGEKNIIYIADGWEGVRIIDVFDQYHPHLIGSYKTPGWAFDVEVKGKILYVADAFKGLRVLDVSASPSPKEIGAYEIKGLTHSGRLFIEKNIVYIADKNSGLHVVDISNINSPSQLNFFDFMEVATGVTTIGNYLCAAAGRNGLQIIDISKPSNLREVGSFQSQRHAFCVATDGRYAYLGAHEGLHIIDISNPFRPKQIGFCQESLARDMEIRGKVAYMANEDGLLTIDISDPFDPKTLGFIRLMEWPEGGHYSVTEGLDVRGTLACAVGGLIGLKIVDVSNPRSPKLIGQFKNMDYNNDVAIALAFAYTVGGDGLTAFDISNPRQPKKLGVLALPGILEEISVERNIAYVSAGGGGLIMVDISNPRTPVWVGSYNTPGYTEHSYIQDKLIYVADQNGGVQILEKTTGMDLNRISKSLNSTSQRNEISVGLRRDRHKTFPIDAIHKAPFYFRQTGILKPKNEVARELFQRGDDAYQYPSTSTSSKKLIVTNPNDSGQGSLRWCLENAQRGDVISFDSSIFPPNNPTTIALVSQLPDLVQGNITIDASDAGVIISGKKLSGNAHGIRVLSPGNKIRGLQILDFPSQGISIEGDKGDRNTIGGDRTKGRGPVGQGNVLSRNGVNGVTISEGGNNVILGNLIGTDVSGKKRLGNKTCGVWIHGRNNRIGGDKPGERNIISGNGFHGLLLNTDKSSGNTVVGNYIGTDITGTRMLSNKMFGVSVELGAYNNAIKNNVIVADGQASINIFDSGSSYNVVVGNLIGTDTTGKVCLGRGSSIGIGGGAEFNRIGGSNPKERNVINVEGGIQFGRQAASGNLMIGNFIGTDLSGTKPIGKLKEGIRLGSGCRRPFIGGTTEGERNVFGDFEWAGITVDQTVDYAWIAGNYFGVSASGETPLSKNGSGVCVDDYTEQNAVQGNLFSGNTGIDLDGEKNVLVGNTIMKARNGLFASGNNNLIYKNKFIENQFQATDSGNDEWDRNGIGNYWSDYRGVDANRDGIGDTPYQIPPNGVDHYPLMSASVGLTVQVNPQGSGKATIVPNKSSYSYGENVRLTANPSNGYTFSLWSGDCPSGHEKDNPLTIAMHSNKVITANFVSNSTSYLSISKRLLNFGAVEKGAKTPYQKFQILAIGKEALDWQITDNAGWLACSPTAGLGNALINVSVDPAGLAVGTYAATISVFSSQSSVFQNITAMLQVMPPSEAGAPFGEWDKPLESPYTYQGCFPFSGWALDKIGIESVKIYRLKAPIDNRSSPEEIYFGDAFFVEGARPDIEASYPYYPQCSQAGWGFNFVSDILPGDGFYTFMVKVKNVSGTIVEIGRRNIRINNLFSLKPFGVIDSPKPGETVSGTFYHSSGWALGKGQTHISEVNLYIDSEYKKTASFGFPQPEIKLLLPRIIDLDLGFRVTFEPTSLSDTYHTTFVIAQDRDGRQSVLGSGYFYNANQNRKKEPKNSKENIIEKDEGALDRKFYGDEIRLKKRKKIEYVEEHVEIQVNELKTIAIKGFSEEASGIEYKAFYNDQEILPLGMSLDEKKGLMSWLPIPGFIGEFRIEILKIRDFYTIDRKDVVFFIK